MMRRRESAAPAAAAAEGQPTSDICFLTATEMARRLRKKDLSAREVLTAHLQQIERINPRVNAIVTLVAEQARERARRLDEAAARNKFSGPLHGLPIAHKDLVDTKGIRTTYGSPIFKDHTPESSSLLVERIEAAGAVLIGKTNTPEFGAGSQTFNPVFGATRNPWDLTKTCGGSSGGAAVSLACGMLPIADGTDLGGSLRNPASFCSVVGFRPSPGRVPRVPSSFAWNSMNVSGPMARNVQDVALLLSAMAGPDPRDPLSIHEPGSRFSSQALGRNCKGLRIAWIPKLGGVPYDGRVLSVVEAQREKFESLGCTVEDAEPDFSGADESFRVLRALDAHLQLGHLLATQRALIKSTVIQELEMGARLTGPQIAQAELLRSRLYARIGEWMRKYDFFVAPVSQVPPYDVEWEYPTEIAGTRMGNYIDWQRSCYYVTMTAFPAISVPAGFTQEGLPVGIQIVGRRQDDWGVLQIAHAFEQVSGVRDLRPPITSLS